MNHDKCGSIEEIRGAIDDIDYQILTLFSQRYAFVKEIVRYKTDEASVVAESRQREVIVQRCQWAAELGLNPDLFEKIYRILLDYNVRKELELLKETTLK